MKLENKVSVVTGAAGGQGIEICKIFAAEGSNIIGLDIDTAGLEKMVSEVRNIGRKVISFKTDVSKVDEVEEAFKKVEKDFGKVDILVNAAGKLGKMGYMINLNEDDWNYLLDNNAKGTFLCDKAAVLLMIKGIKAKRQKNGKIINISSICGKRGFTLCAPYNASKFAVTAITQTLAQEITELGYEINVNAVAPGVVNTNMNKDEAKQVAKLFNKKPEEVNADFINSTPLKRLTQPSDIAYACLYLASSDSDMVTGQTLNVCGGMLIG